MLRKLAGASRQVPKSYLVGMFTRYKVKDKVIATGGSGDIREGRLAGMVVAVKTIRTTPGMRIETIHQVCDIAGCLLTRQLINMAIKPRPSARNASFG